MKEEKVTILILQWLQNNGWEIVCFDFPQSGTGVSLHPNQTIRANTKNKGVIIPDIVANKNNITLFFENKNRFVVSDFEKLNHLKHSGAYQESILTLLENFPTNDIYYGIGLPYSKNVEKNLLEHNYLVDFVLTITEDLKIEIFKGKEIFNLG